MSWGGDVEDSDDSEDGEESLPGFASTFEKTVRGSGSVTDIGESELYAGIDEVDDLDLLKEGWLQVEGERSDIIERRIRSLDGSLPSESADEGESESEEESPDSEDTSDDWGSDEPSEDDVDSEGPEPAIESMEDLDEDSPGSDEDSAQTGREPSQNGPPAPSSSVSPDELLERERRWKIMTWGPPKLFKTHFAYTMPEPIAFIDLEGKADDILKKFQGKEIQFWRPQEMEAEPDTKFRRAKKAVDEALEWLNWYYENEDRRGTIVVDSMSLLWEWAQTHHKIENHPLTDVEDVELSSNFNSSAESDWAVIKEYHNGEVREHITDSPFHFYWTAMERVSFEKTFEDEDNKQIMEPTGEPKNTYKADTVIQARKDDERGKVGDLVGSNFTDNVFVGLKKPTFEKVQKAIERIEEAESGPSSVSRSQLADEIDAEAIIDHDPQRYVQ